MEKYLNYYYWKICFDSVFFFSPSVVSLVDDITAYVICSHLAGAASYQSHSHSWGKEKKKKTGIAPHAHTSEKAYLESTVCHGQHDVFVSNGSCIRLGNMTEHTRAVSDAMRASSFLLSSVFSLPLYHHKTLLVQR